MGTASDFCIFYNLHQCTALVCGFSRSACKRFVIPKTVHSLISEFMDSSLTLSFAADHDTIFSHFIDRSSEKSIHWCEAGEWYIALMERQYDEQMLCYVPFQVIEISTHNFGRVKSRDQSTTLTV